jgi:predicted alpha-1,6-mannanase (GH76 family)
MKLSFTSPRRFDRRTRIIQMKKTMPGLPHRVRHVLCALATLILVRGVARKASAEPSVSQIQSLYADYNANFECDDGGNESFAAVSGTCTPTGLWTSAELIEMAEDAYTWAKNADSVEVSAYTSEVTALADGFNGQHASWWNGADSYDDDMMWATIAFVRAYYVTGTSAFLTEAEEAFNTVYNRGLASNGGIYWNSSCGASCASRYENSAANWTFVIAGHMLTSASGNSTYATEANGVWSWAIANLYNSSTGEIYDGVTSTGTNTGQYSYNYGTAIGAAQESVNASYINSELNYLMYYLGDYAGTSNGYNILPNYGQGNQDGSGFNGIALRWLGVAERDGNLSSTALSWVQTNLDCAWNEQSSKGIIWNDWVATTPTSPEYAWDSSDALVGYFNFDPVP